MPESAVLDQPPAAAAEDDARWDAELGACAADPAYFIDCFGVIDKPKRPGAERADFADELAEPGATESGTVPFRLWPAQVPVLGTLATERLVLILKARQLGISWLVCGYVLWLCLFHTHQAIFLFSRTQDDADELIRRIKALYHRLPQALKDRLPGIGKKDSVREVVWTNASRVKSMPSTRNSGVGNTASLVVLDEWARMPWGDTLFESVKPVMEAGGQLIILSTAEGMNWFHTMWDRAVKGLNSFRRIFLPWWARPGRDRAWHAGVLRDSNDPEKVLENYPATAIEAFRATGRIRFQPAWIDRQGPNVRDSLPEYRWPGSLRGVPRLRLYQPPIAGVRYLVSADTAEGKETSNYDAGVVIREDTWEEVALVHGQWEPDIFALWLIALGYAYNTAWVVPERNNHGHAVLATLKLKGYPRIATGHDDYPGWVTGSNKDEMIDDLAKALRLQLITVRSEAALNEMRVYKRLKNGRTGAEPPYFDDIVMAWAVALAWLKLKRSRQEAAKPEVGGAVTKPTGFLPVPRLGFPGVKP
jgi:hypothetical protein